MPFHFPKPFQHKHGPIKNVNDVIAGQMTLGQKIAERVAAVVGAPVLLSLKILTCPAEECGMAIILYLEAGTATAANFFPLTERIRR